MQEQSPVAADATMEHLQKLSWEYSSRPWRGDGAEAFLVGHPSCAGSPLPRNYCLGHPCCWGGLKLGDKGCLKPSLRHSSVCGRVKLSLNPPRAHIESQPFRLILRDFFSLFRPKTRPALKDSPIPCRSTAGCLLQSDQDRQKPIQTAVHGFLEKPCESRPLPSGTDHGVRNRVTFILARTGTRRDHSVHLICLSAR